ncbi:MAG: dTDP-4-amino-4,6-dideoxygalactose transaminase [Bryobacteraceae bacterium]|nr:dTDP-4-amino-4,6-dideoxygalactose transaminase [Bryobacteraceae bacterium]
MPFNKPSLCGKELLYVAEAILRGHTAGDGSFTRQCHEFLQKTLAVPRALLTTSCTHALEMSALLLDIRPGDEVIVPAFTFVSTVNAFVLRGAQPIFADVRPDTLNVDEQLLPDLISERTRAIIPVHYAGVACEMDAICGVAARVGASVVEDNAHGLFGRYRGRLLGTLGGMATQSFHETKNLTCGEGGALIINDPTYIERAEILREKGTNRSRFYRGQVDKYTWVDVGSSFLPSDILAAYLYAQLEEWTTIQKKRRALWDNYLRELMPWAMQQGVQLPFVPDHCMQSYHMFYLVMPSLTDRQGLIESLRNRGILAVFHYLPLNVSEMGRKLGGVEGQCPVTESVANRLLRLPFYNDLTEGEQSEVIDAVTSFTCGPA